MGIISFHFTCDDKENGAINMCVCVRVRAPTGSDIRKMTQQLNANLS